jgi:type IV secretory pathway VirD2 relaxase
MSDMERDLGTKLDWTAVDIGTLSIRMSTSSFRGKADDGRDLVVSRDYISHGMRARAEQLVTLELGPRSDLEIRQGLEAEIGADRWTKLDCSLVAEAVRSDRLVDWRPSADRAGQGHLQATMIGRMRKLDGLA